MMKRNRVLLVLLAVFAIAFGLHARQPLAGAGTVSQAWRSEDEERLIDIYKRTNQAVVFITTTTLTVDPFDVFLRVQPQEGTGSGIVVDARRGIILTNFHVIRNAERIEATMADGSALEAKLIGTDPDSDLAVLRLSSPPEDMVGLEFADSSGLEVGQRVLAIGNPFGLNRTLTQGIISSLNRSIKSPTGRVLKGLIQTDAAINPGNSGGPLIDMDGRLIGVNTAILSQSGDSAGIGFAVPINRVKKVLPELIATGKVLRPEVGWVLVDTNQGPMVYKIFPKSPADRAAIQPILRWVRSAFGEGFVRDIKRADLIVAVNGTRVFKREEVEDVVAESSPSAPVELTLRRGGLRGEERVVTISPEML